MEKVYGRKWSVVADQELRNDSSWTAGIGKAELDKYDKGKLEEFKQGRNPRRISHILLTDMCNNGHLESGKYLIEVCW